MKGIKYKLVFQPVILVLFDIPPMLQALEGVQFELQDCSLSTLQGYFHFQLLSLLHYITFNFLFFIITFSYRLI